MLEKEENMKGVLIVHRELGVYLGSCMGLGFWSKLDAVGQPCAYAFDDEADAKACMATWEQIGSKEEIITEADVTFMEVDHEELHYATVEECHRAGAPAWSP